MVLRPAYYLADFMTGQMLGPVLPLEAVTLVSDFQPGHFRASLDMRKAADSFAESAEILDMLEAGKCTVVPVLEGLSNGHANPAASRALGEWWISTVARDYSDPVVRLSGPEFAGYFKDLLVTQTWQGSFTAWALVRDMMREATRTSQTISFSTGVGGGGPTVEADIQKSRTDYWSAIQSVQDDNTAGFEWRVSTSLGLDGIVPVSVVRTLTLGAPTIRYDRRSVTLELTTPGSTPASLTGMSRTTSEHASASTVYGFGAGGGEDQYSGWTSRSRVPGEPGKSKLIVVRDAMSNNQVRRATARALQRATPDDRVFPVSMPTDRFTPTLGELYSFLREPSWSFPTAESGDVRCAGWSWSQPRPGEADEYVVQLVKEA